MVPALRTPGLVRTTVTTAAVVLVLAAPRHAARAQTEICGDLDASGAITAADALRLLQRAVGQDVTLQCPVCQSSTTSTITGPTTTLGGGPTTTVPIGTTTTVATCSFPGASCNVNADCCQNEGSAICCDESCVFAQACKLIASPCECDAQCCSGVCGSAFAGLCD